MQRKTLVILGINPALRGLGLVKYELRCTGEAVPTLPDVLAKLSFLTATPAIAGLVITASLIVVIRDWRFSLAALLGQYVLVGLLLTRLIQPEVALTKVLIGALVCVVLYLTARPVGVSGDGVLSPRRPEPFVPGPCTCRPWSFGPVLRPYRTKCPRTKGPGQVPKDQGPVEGSKEGPILEQEAAENGRSPLRAIRGGASLAGFSFRLLAALFVGLAVYSLSKYYSLPKVPSDIGFACYWLASLGLLVLMLTEEPLKAGMGLLTVITGFELFYAALEHSLSVAGFLGIANFLIALAIAYLTPSTALRRSLSRAEPRGSGQGSGRRPSTGSGRRPSTSSGQGAASGSELTAGERGRC